MKMLSVLFATAFLFIATTLFAQDQKSVFESASLVSSAEGAATVQLAWKKGAENTAYYLVERSTDGINFKQVALVFTWEDSQFTAYKHRDKGFSLSGNALYYRIVIVNDQKELSYLPVKRVELSTVSLAPAMPASPDFIASKK